MKNDKTVLIIEDDEKYRGILNTLLTRENINVLTAENGLDALETIKENGKIDLIILDLLMPKMGGWNFMYELPKTKAKNTPILILTNLTEADYPADQPVQLDFMTKANVSIEEVVEKVKKYLLPKNENFTSN